MCTWYEEEMAIDREGEVVCGGFWNKVRIQFGHGSETEEDVIFIVYLF